MSNAMMKWLGGAGFAVCLALTPFTLTPGEGGSIDARLSDAQCTICCKETASICVPEVPDEYDPGSSSCPGGDGPHIEYRY